MKSESAAAIACDFDFLSLSIPVELVGFELLTFHLVDY